MVRGAPVLMVEADPVRVEEALAAGELTARGVVACWAGGAGHEAGGCAAAAAGTVCAELSACA